MNRLYVGLLIAVIVGLAIALFPLYSSHLANFLWSEERVSEENTHMENYMWIIGRVERVDMDHMLVKVDGKEIVVRGVWELVMPGGEREEVEAGDLLAMLKPGMTVKVKIVERGRWIQAEELEFDGYKAVRMSECE